MGTVKLLTPGYGLLVEHVGKDYQGFHLNSRHVSIFRNKAQAFQSKDCCLCFSLFFVAADHSWLIFCTINQYFKQELLVVSWAMVKDQGVVR